MAYQVLSRKWRPQTFQEVVGQEHITRSLQHAILRNRLGHAYLLTGTRGIGKTSVARIFAKALRCENRLEDGNPCCQCKGCEEISKSSSMNVIEIDGASNNSVDDIRDLINKIQALPTFGNFKIYIIDEVHMLSVNAFNALLKTLEEPPEHVIFLLATTEPEKLLSTILSRCQRFDFRNASVETLVKHVENIAEKEGIQFASNKLIKSICIQGAGSFRDTLSLIDQVLCFSTERVINEEMVSMALGLAKTSSIRSLAEGMLNGDVKSVSKIYRSILYENVSLENICQELLDYLYEVITDIDRIAEWLSLDVELTAQELFWIYESLAQDFEWTLRSLSPEKVVEVVLHKVTLRRTFFSSEDEKDIVVKKKINPIIKEKLEEQKLSSTQASEQKKQRISIESVSVEMNEKLKSWTSFISYLRNISPVTASNLEQGNVLEEIDFNSEKTLVQIGFKLSGKVFYAYLQESEVKDKLKKHFSHYAGKNPDTVEIDLVLIDGLDRKSKNFKTRVEIEIENEKNLKEERENKILNNPIIKQAEEMFHSKVDSIRLNT